MRYSVNLEESFEIYFNDLHEEAQKAFLEFMGITDPKEGNYDVFPLATIPKGEDVDE